MTTKVLGFSSVKNIINTVMGVSFNYTWCDHFTVHTNIEALCCTLETHIMLFVNYISIKNMINYSKKQTTTWDERAHRLTPQRLRQVSERKRLHSRKTDGPTRKRKYGGLGNVKKVCKMLTKIMCCQFLSLVSE